MVTHDRLGGDDSDAATCAAHQAPVVLSAFDHLVVAVRDLAAASETYRRLGFDVRPGGRNPGQGTYNSIIRFGIDYIELLSIEDETLARDRAPGGQELRAYLAARAGGAAAWVAQSDDIVADTQRALDAGFQDIGMPLAMRRARPDGTEFAWQLLIPRGQAFRRPWPLIIQWDTSDAQRLAWEPTGRHDNGVLGVRSLSLVVPSVDEARAVYETRLRVPLGPSESVDELGAAVLRSRIGDLDVSLLAPLGAGPIADELASQGPGPYELGLAVADLDRTTGILRDHGIGLVEDLDGSVVIDPDEACGVRLRLRADTAAATP